MVYTFGTFINGRHVDEINQLVDEINDLVGKEVIEARNNEDEEDKIDVVEEDYFYGQYSSPDDVINYLDGIRAAINMGWKKKETEEDNQSSTNEE